MKTRLAVFILAVFLFSMAAYAQTWTQLSPSGVPPAARRMHSAIYDETSNRMTVFGGTQAGCPFICQMNDTWLLSNANGSDGTPQWTPISPLGTPPTPRFGHSAVNDEATNSMIVFGGISPGSCPSPTAQNDVWVLSNSNDLGGTPTWSELSPTGPAPSARRSHTAVYDRTTNRMIVYGGFNDCGGGLKSDVWVLSNANGQAGVPAWSQLSPSGTVPCGRAHHAAAYDESTNRMIVMGGLCDDPAQNDVWVLSNANGLGGTPTWTQLATTNAPPYGRAIHSAVYDPTANTLTVFGGCLNSNCVPAGPLNDSWVLIHANGLGGSPSWTQFTPAGSLPLARSGHSATYSLPTNRMTIFGGGDDYQNFGLNDVWTLADANGGTPNQPPVADAGANQTVECASPAGTDVTLDGSASSDPDQDTLSYEWRDVGNNIVGTDAVLNLLLPLGTHTFTLTVSDGNGGSASDSVQVVVQDTTPPTLTLSSTSETVVVPAASSTGVAVDVLVASGAAANDLCDPSPSLSHDGPAVFPIGTTIVTITATDDSGNYSQKTFTVHVVYSFIGFLPPIRNDGSSIFRSGRTVPVKFQLTAADGSFISNATATLQVFKVTDQVLGTVEEVTPDASGSSNTGNLFRYDSTSNQYIYDLSTKGYSVGTYLLRAVLNDGTVHEVYVSVR